MPPKAKNKRPYSDKRDADMKLRRHELYRQMSLEKKEELLLHRRVKDLEKFNLSRSVASHGPAQFSTQFQQQTTPPCGSCSTSTTVHKEVDITSDFKVFEVGSTSGTSKENCNVSLEIARRKGCRSRKTDWLSVAQMESEYVPLKIVPSCRCCGAKRFEYETPCFCCGNGSIRLASHQQMKRLSSVTYYIENSQNTLCGHHNRKCGAVEEDAMSLAVL